jgi:hypothetical protein
MTRWVRLYCHVVDNPKVQRLAPGVFRAWINLLCVAGKHDGRLGRIADMAFALRLPEDEMGRIAAVLVENRLLVADGDGYRLHDWDEHQYASDSSAERTRRYRARKQPVTECDVTRNVTVTPQIRTEQNRTDIGAQERAIPFPSDGSIEFTLWASIARKNKPNHDVDKLASAFRDWCRAKQIAFDSGNIAKTFATFCQRHNLRASA